MECPLWRLHWALVQRYPQIWLPLLKGASKKMVESSFLVEGLQNLGRLSLSAQVCVVHCQNKQVIFVILRNHFSLNVPYWWRVDHIIYHFTELKIYHHSLFINGSFLFQKTLSSRIFVTFSGHPKGLKVGESGGKKRYRFCGDTSAAKLYRTLNNSNDVPLREYKLMLSFQTR